MVYILILMKFSVINLGCRSNYFDGELLAQKLTEKGYTRVQEQADIYIINTCTVTSEADRSSRQFIYRAKRENPKAIVVLRDVMPKQTHRHWQG